MNLIDNKISLLVDIFVEDGQYKVSIEEENAAGGITSNVKNIKDISKALENYLSNNKIVY